LYQKIKGLGSENDSGGRTDFLLDKQLAISDWSQNTIYNKNLKYLGVEDFQNMLYFSLSLSPDTPPTT
jgi:hypothetical protein